MGKMNFIFALLLAFFVGSAFSSHSHGGTSAIPKTMQMRPTRDLATKDQSGYTIRTSSRPERSVSILRTHERDGLHSNFSQTKNSGSFEDWAIAYNNRNGPYIGVSGRLMLWAPHTEPGEQSLTFAACGVGGAAPSSVMKNSIAAGWGIFPSLHGDYQTRFFIALIKADGNWCFAGTPCGNKFVQVSKTFAPGYPFDRTSSYGDPKRQFFVTIDIFKDASLSNWWVAASGERVGYFPNSEVQMLSANTTIWGGAVRKVVPTPTPTAMGSGHFTNEGDGKVGVVFGARVKKAQAGGDVVEKPSGYYVTRPRCFEFVNKGSITPMMDKVGYLFWYGGPGSMSPLCS